MGYPSYMEDIREEVDGHFDPMGWDEQAASSDKLSVRKGKRVRFKPDRTISDSENGIESLLAGIPIRGAVGVVNCINKHEAKVAFCIEGKTIIMELPLSLLEKVS